MEYRDFVAREIAFAPLVGVVHVVVVFAAFADRQISVSGVDDLLILGYLVGGLFLIAAVPTLLLARRSVIPILVLMGVFSFVVYSEWQISQQSTVAFPPTPATLYTFGWVVVLPLLLVIGKIESAFKLRRNPISDRG